MQKRRIKFEGISLLDLRNIFLLNLKIDHQIHIDNMSIFQTTNYSFWTSSFTTNSIIVYIKGDFLYADLTYYGVYFFEKKILKIITKAAEGLNFSCEEIDLTKS